MPLPFVKIEPFTGVISFDELAQALLKEVISADATMQLYQRAAWREAVGGSETIEGLDRLENLGLAQVRFAFHLEPVSSSWASRAWGVLTEPLGRGWFSRVARILATPPRGFRLASSTASGGVAVSITMSREQSGMWKVQREPQELINPMAPLAPAPHDAKEAPGVADLIG
jgi:hypothetical protein